MDIQQAYNSWAEQYDTNINKTRDLEGQALRSCLRDVAIGNCLEIGCGTGKNTQWLMEKAAHITAVDLSGEMLAKAREKIHSDHVDFRQANIMTPWTFADRKYDLVTFSLVLEHIDHLDPVFRETAAVLHPGGVVYIGELHPFRQYTGSKARFDTPAGRQVVECYTHHVSDFISIPGRYGLIPAGLDEYFDENDRTTIPRILTVLLKKV